MEFPDDSPLRGKISVSPSGILETKDFLTNLEGNFKFNILVKDDSYSSTLDSELTILRTKKCQPVFEKNQEVIFEIQEDIKKDAVVGEVNGLLEDSECPEIEYKVEALKPEDSEFVQMEVNKIKVNSEEVRKINFEKIKEKRIPIVISINSGNLFSRKPAEIRIIKKSNNRIQYPQSAVRLEVEENTVGKLLDLRKVSKEKIYFKLENNFNGIFEIEDGSLELRKPIDKEENDFYRLKVVASVDNEFKEESSDEITVNVFVKDV